MRAQNLRNARQPAGEHRRVLGAVHFIQYVVLLIVSVYCFCRALSCFFCLGRCLIIRGAYFINAGDCFINRGGYFINMGSYSINRGGYSTIRGDSFMFWGSYLHL